MVDDAVRQELADFLKTRRARLTPADVGLSVGSGRRAKGLRREEVAVLAGIGLTWYTWLEQGRDTRVSAPFLENLARALRLSAAERTHLFALAQRRLPPIVTSTAEATRFDTNMVEKLQAILDVIEAPAYARNSRFDVMAWNSANTRMFGDFATLPPQDRNIIRRVFGSPYHRRTMVNWEQDARGLVARLRLNHGQATETADLDAFVREMIDRSDDFRRMWADHDVTDAGEGVYLYATKTHGTIAFQHSTLVPEAMPAMRIVLYVRLKGGAEAP